MACCFATVLVVCLVLDFADLMVCGLFWWFLWFVCLLFVWCLALCCGVRYFVYHGCVVIGLILLFDLLIVF